MAITNVLATSQTFATGLTHTLSITVPDGADRILYATHAGSDPATSGGFTVTYNGVALTKLAGNGLNTNGMAVYYLVNPDVGTHDLVWTGSTSFTTGLYGTYVFTGVNQASPLGAPVTYFQSYAPSSSSLSFTPVTGGVIFSFIQVRQTTGVVSTAPASLVDSDVYSPWTLGVSISQPGASSIGWSGWVEYIAVNHIAVMMNPAESGATTHEITISNSVQTNTVSDVAIDNTVAGTHNITISSAQQVNTVSTVAIQQIVPGSGTITTPEVRDWETRNLKTGLTGVQVDVRSIETGALIVRKTGLTTHATTAVCTITDAAIPNVTLCEVMMRCPDGSKGVWDLMSV